MDDQQKILVGAGGVLGAIALVLNAMGASQFVPNIINQIFGATPSPSPPVISQSIAASPSTPTAAFSPERSLNIYAQSLTNRDYGKLRDIFPNGNEATQRAWLEGTNEEPRITVVQVFEDTERLPSSETGVVVLRATMMYCRADRSGSTDVKNYTFFQNQGLWKLESSTRPKDHTSIQC